MYTKKHTTPFLAQLKPSKKIQQFLIVIHLLALAASFTNALPTFVKLCIATLIAVNFKMNYRQYHKEQRIIKYTEKSGWEVSVSGDFEPVHILKSSVITTTLIFLQLQNKPTVVIAKDALSDDEYRQLIVKLKMTIH